MGINPNYALQTPNNKEQIEKSVSYGVLSSLECSPKRCIPLELKIVRLARDIKTKIRSLCERFPLYSERLAQFSEC